MDDRQTAGSQAAAKRAARNTTVRAVGDIVGKLASLALMAGLGRAEGPVGLGILLLAMAWAELATVPIEMGFDRYLMRRVAREPASVHALFANVLLLKLRRAVPVTVLSIALLFAIGYDQTARTVVYLMSASFLLDSLTATAYSVFTAHERGGLTAFSLVAQRIMSGGGGLTVVVIGYGVVTVAVVYLVASIITLALTFWLLARRIEMPQWTAPKPARAELRRHSLPFATQEIFSVGIGRADTVLLSALATKTVVGLYGAAYRLLEATLFISNALTSAFGAMFTYLDEHSDPPVRAVFQRAIKLSLILLLPCMAVLLVLAEPVLELVFGGDFDDAVTPLRILAPTVVVLGIVLMAGALVVSRADPRPLVRWFGIAMVVNIGLNVALIPTLEASGAAIAMLATELLLAAVSLRLAAQAVGALDVPRTVGSALIATVVMAAAMAPLHGLLPVALAAGAIAYTAVLAVCERLISPGDLTFVLALVRERGGARPAAAAEDIVA